MSFLDNYRGRTVLVTGGAGAIGSNLSRALSAAVGPDGWVVVLDDLSASARWNVPDLANVVFVQGDILDEVKLKRVFCEKPSIIFHLAAFFANQNSVDHPENDLMVNGMGTLRLMEYATLAGCDRFVYASSVCSIYGSATPLPLTEDLVSMHMTTPYQITKMLGELYGNFFHHHHDLPVVKTRFFNSYGPGEIPGQYRNVIPNFIYWAMKGLPLPITGTGDETRDFTFVGDIVDGLLRAAVHPAATGEVFNLASGRETTIRDLAEMIITATGSTAGIKQAEPRKWDTRKRLPTRVDKARSVLGYSPSTRLEQGIAANLVWFREHWDRIEAGNPFAPGASSALRSTTGSEAGDGSALDATNHAGDRRRTRFK